MKKVLLPGGTGFLGRVLARHFLGKGREVVVLTRGEGSVVPGVRFVLWDGRTVGAWAGKWDRVGNT